MENTLREYILIHGTENTLGSPESRAATQQTKSMGRPGGCGAVEQLACAQREIVPTNVAFHRGRQRPARISSVSPSRPSWLPLYSSATLYFFTLVDQRVHVLCLKACPYVAVSSIGSKDVSGIFIIYPSDFTIHLSIYVLGDREF